MVPYSIPANPRQTPRAPLTGHEVFLPAKASTGPASHGAIHLQSVLILDEREPFLTSLGTSFRNLGFDVWIESSPATAMNVLRTTLPDLVVSELTLQGQSMLDRLPEIREANPRCLFALVTANPSVQAAAEAMRQGVAAYLAKPASAPLILDTLAANGDIDPEMTRDLSWPSLDRTIWDYLNQVFLASGSMSEAARRLKVDRRSLRRMLGRQAPCL